MKKLLLSFGLIYLFSGCLKSKDEEQFSCNYDPCSIKASATEIQALKDTLAKYNITATEHCSGLFYAVKDTGTGTAPNACSTVTVQYKGMFPNGTVFDQTDSTETITYPLSGFIRGWLNGIPLIKAGGKIDLYIPPTLGYGNKANGPIPANSVLFFEVQLKSVQ